MRSAPKTFMALQALAIILLIFSSKPALPCVLQIAELSLATEGSFERFQTSLNELRMRLFQQLENPDPIIQQLKKDAPPIQKVIELIHRGTTTFGVYAVQTPIGRKALKILKAEDADFNLEGLKTSIVLQNAFNNIGGENLSPRIHGIISVEEINRLRDADPILRNEKEEAVLNQGSSYGLLMDEIPNAWEVGKPYARATPFAQSPEVMAKIEFQFKIIGAAFNALRILDHDINFIITKEGRVYVIDFDDMLVMSTNRKIYGRPFVISQIQKSERHQKFLKPDGPFFSTDVDDLIKVFYQNLDIANLIPR